MKKNIKFKKTILLQNILFPELKEKQKEIFAKGKLSKRVSSQHLFWVSMLNARDSIVVHVVYTCAECASFKAV